ncbi:MAG: PAN domain-containing protein [Hyphomonadaceae bacterium]
MRLVLLAASTLASFAAIGAASSSEPGVARPGGTYQTLPASSANDCAAACARDGLCLSWTFLTQTYQCELKAVIPQPVLAASAVSGLSQRAPDFMRAAARLETTKPKLHAPQSMAQAEIRSPALETQPLGTPAQQNQAQSAAIAQAASLHLRFQPVFEPGYASADPEEELLGGPLASR